MSVPGPAAAPLAQFLEPGERVDHLVFALEGPNRWLALAGSAVAGFAVGLLLQVPILALFGMWIVYTSLYARRLVAVTDRSVVVLSGTRYTFRATGVLDRLPRATPLGPLKGPWLATTIAGRRLYVRPRSMRQVLAADRAIEP